MRAAVVEDGIFTVTHVADPTPEPTELLVRVAAAGVCGSDVKTAAFMPPGTVMGHEFAGEIVAVGESVRRHWQVGTPVAAMPVLGCGSCPNCVFGDLARCDRVRTLGLGIEAGGFAELVRVGAAETVALPEDVSPQHGALVEPLAVGLHAVAAAHIRPGDRVLVVGGGSVGATVVVWAARMGAAEVVVSEPVLERRGAAMTFGAHHTIDPTVDSIGTDYDVAIECVGAPGMLDHCVAAVRAHGRIVVAGVCMTPDPFVSAVAVVKEVEMRFVSYYTKREFELAAQLLGNGSFDADVFVTQRVGLEALNQVLTELSRPNENLKVLVEPLRSMQE